MTLSWTVVLCILAFALVASAILRPDLALFLIGTIRGAQDRIRGTRTAKPPLRPLSDEEFQRRLRDDA